MRLGEGPMQVEGASGPLTATGWRPWDLPPPLGREGGPGAPRRVLLHVPRHGGVDTEHASGVQRGQRGYIVGCWRRRLTARAKSFPGVTLAAGFQR
jgi:hypothetical protein